MKTGWRKNYLRQKSYFLNMVSQYKERADIRTYLEILLSLLTISVFAIFALRPTLLTIAELLKEIGGKKAVIVQMDDKISKLNKAQILYDQKRDQVLMLKNSIPDNPKPNDIIRQFEGLSADYSLIITNFTLGEAPIKGNPSKGPNKVKGDKEKINNLIPVTTNISTDITNYPAIENMLKGLENLRLPLVVNNLTLVTNQIENGQIVSLNLDGGFLFNDIAQKPK